MTGDRGGMGEGVVVDGHTLSAPPTAGDVERLAGLIKPLAERCDRLARSRGEYLPSKSPKPASASRQALINLFTTGAERGPPDRQAAMTWQEAAETPAPRWHHVRVSAAGSNGVR